MKPLLAVACEDITAIRYPVLASPKLDGIRCLVISGEVYSRNMKLIPNDHVRACLADLPDCDGELIVGEPTAPDCFNKTTSAVMSKAGSPEFTYRVFDWLNDDRAFQARYDDLDNNFDMLTHTHAVVVEHQEIGNPADLAKYEAMMVGFGYEGIMIRDPNGAYKQGRSTLKEGILLKVKRFHDMEAEIVGVEELMRNENEAGVDALGRTERSTRKEGLRAGDTMGALICRAAGYTETFKIGTGYTAEMRQDMWNRRSELVGQRVKFKHQPAGAKDAPRFPVFLGFRPEGA